MKVASFIAITSIFFICGANTQDVPKVTSPVPVVQPEEKDSKPKEPTKEVIKGKSDSLPVATEEAGAVLPLSFVKNKVDLMPLGTKAYISVEAIKCDSKRRAYLDPDQMYGTQNEGRVVLVSKDSFGYHISLEKVDHQWTCQELPPGIKWISIKTITSR